MISNTDAGFDKYARDHIAAIDHYGSSWKYDFAQDISPDVEAFLKWHDTPIFSVWYRNGCRININPETGEVEKLWVIICGARAAHFVNDACVNCGVPYSEHPQRKD